MRELCARYHGAALDLGHAHGELRLADELVEALGGLVVIVEAFVVVAAREVPVRLVVIDGSVYIGDEGRPVERDLGHYPT